MNAPPNDPARRLTAEQQDALSRLRALAQTGTFRVALLHGVTGSGKTEIYLRLSAEMLAAGRGVLMLVPEIALTPAVAALFRQAFGDRVAIQHSGLSDGERHDQWQRIRRGDVDGRGRHALGGLRAARPSRPDRRRRGARQLVQAGREPALQRTRRGDRARRSGPGRWSCSGSATPSMETYHNAVTGKYERIVLERRVLDRPLAAVTIVDMREEYAHGGPDVVLSRLLTTAIDERVATRRAVAGAAEPPRIRDVGLLPAVRRRRIDCPNCSVSLVVHGEGSAAPGALPLLQLLGARAGQVRRCARRRISSRPASAPSASRRK